MSEILTPWYSWEENAWSDQHEISFLPRYNIPLSNWCMVTPLCTHSFSYFYWVFMSCWLSTRWLVPPNEWIKPLFWCSGPEAPLAFSSLAADTECPRQVMHSSVWCTVTFLTVKEDLESGFLYLFLWCLLVWLDILKYDNEHQSLWA